MRSFGGWFLSVAVSGAFVLFGSAPKAVGQQPPKPGPEFDILRDLVGTWEATVKMEGMPESKGTVRYKMGVGGLWLTSNFKSSFAGQPFEGRGFDTYDAGKKKYVSVWVDSMSTTPMVSEGTYDPKHKTLTMASDFPGPDGKMAKYKSVAKFTDKDTIDWKMGTVDGKVTTPMMSITYKRKATAAKKAE